MQYNDYFLIAVNGKKDKLSYQDCQKPHILLCSDGALISDSAQNTVMLTNDLKHSR